MTGLLVISIETLSKSTLYNFPFIRKMTANNLNGMLIPSAGYVNYHGWMSGLAPQKCGKAFRYILPSKSSFRIETPKCISAPGTMPDELYDIFTFCESQKLNSPNYWEAQGESYKTIFEHASRNCLSQHVSIWPDRIDINQIHKWSKKGFLSGADFVFCEIGDADSIAHESGSSSQHYTKIAQEIDYVVESIWFSCKILCPSCEIIIFGDNGMTPVNNYVDILATLQYLGVTPSNSTIFVDAVITRVWIKNSSAMEKLLRFDWASISTFILDEKIKGELQMDLDRNIIGDVAFMSTPGSMFYPNYFNEKKELGTHGYGVLSKMEYPHFVQHSPASSNTEELPLAGMEYIYKAICDALTCIAKSKYENRSDY